MTWQSVALIGVGLQIMGTVLAIRGLIQTWRTYSSDPLVPAWGHFKTAIRMLRLRLPQRFRGAPQQAEGAALAGTVNGRSGGSATLSAPSTPADFVEVGRLLDALENRIGQVALDARAALDRVRADLDLGLDKEAQASQQQVRDLAIGGVRTALFGLGVILVGTVFQVPALL